MELTDAIAVAERALGRDGLTGVLIETPGDELVFEIAGDRGYVLKESDAVGASRQVWALATAARAGVPVPRVIDHGSDPAPWFLMEKLDGVPLSSVKDPEARAALGRSLGEIVARLHAVTLDGFGWVGTAEDVALGGSRSWADAMAGIHRWSLSYIDEHGLLAPDVRAEVSLCIEAAWGWLAGRARGRFLHGDLYESHVFVDRDATRVVGLIDFHGWSGDPGWDLATLCYFERAFGAAVFDGYGSTPDERDLEFYALTLLCNILRWAHERQRRDDTVRWAQQEIASIVRRA